MYPPHGIGRHNFSVGMIAACVFNQTRNQELAVHVQSTKHLVLNESGKKRSERLQRRAPAVRKQQNALP